MAFGMGLLMDIGDASALGQNALAYSITAFLGLMFQRRLSVFGPAKQAPQIGLILFAGQLVLLFAGLLSGSHFPGWDFFLMTIIGMFLWPLVSFVAKNVLEAQV
jgi:rod shape-determining protein MreD